MAKIFALLRDDKIHLKIGKKDKFFEFAFDRVVKYPNIPFYHSVYKDDCIKQFVQFYKENVAKFNFVKSDIFVMLPPDGIEIDEMILKSFFLDTNLFSSVSFINEVFCLRSAGTFVAVSLTERMLVLDYFKDGDIEAEKYYYPLTYSKLDLKRLIQGLHSDCADIEMPLVLNGDSVAIYQELGLVVNKKMLLENAADIVYKK